MLSGGLGDATCSISLGTGVPIHLRFVRTKQRGKSSAASCSVYNIFHGRRFRSFRVALLNSASSLSPAANASGSGESFAPNPFSSSPAPAPVPDPQYVQGVFVNYNWQAYIGYTFTHFSAQGGISRNQNGFNWGIVRYFNSWFGIEGEMFAMHDSPNNQSSWFLFGGGGPRFRWEARRGIEVFAHALVGYSHLTPETAFGTQEAFGYELGGGADFPTPWRRVPSCRSRYDWNAIFQ